MLISILRTLVPYIWGYVIGAALSVLPILEPLRDQLLAYGDAAVPTIALILASAWYVLWRKLEPLLPDWLTRILLGSAKAPVYDFVATYEYADLDTRGRHEAITQDDTDDTTVHSGDDGDYPIGDPHEPTQAAPGRYLP